MLTYSERLTSFVNWPHASPTPTDLAEAGWIFEAESEYPDEVACEECDRCLFNFKPGCGLKMLYIGHSRSCRRYSKLAFVQNSVGSPPKDSQATVLKAPQPTNIGFLDPSLQHDFPELCLFRDVDIFCDRIERCRSESGFLGADILELLPRCLRGEALKWFRSQSKHRNLAECLRALKARFPQAAPQVSQQAPQQASPQTAPQPIGYHHCKLCNASFSSVTRLIQHTQENVCNKPRCRHCEMVFLSKNRLHQHLRERCSKQVHTRRSLSKSSPSPLPEENRAVLPCSPRSSPACSPTCSPKSSFATSPAPSPPPRYQAISPPPPTYLTVADLSARYATPPYLQVDDLFRMFGGRSATTASTKSSTITITIDDPFVRPFVAFKKSMGSTQLWELGMATSHHQISRAQCFPPCCRQSSLLDAGKRQAMPNSA